MKFKKILLLLLVLPLQACKSGNKEKDPLVIPNVDVENLAITLPTRPVYNTGNVRSDSNFDYLDFYEVSDFHGAVNYKSSSSDDGSYIGLAKLATYFNNKRTENPGGTFILSSGDMFQGSAESNLTRGYLVNYSMQYMGFDAMAIGNHEFDWTDEWMKKNAELKYDTSTIPYLGINIIDKRTNEIPTFLNKSVTIERGGYKVGIIGSIGEQLRTSILASCVENYEFKDPASLVEEEASNLKKNGCNVVIWLNHEGVDTIKPVFGVDAIFGGHAHVHKSETAVVPMAATANYGKGVAHISLKINKDTKAVTCEKCEVNKFTSSIAESLSDDANIRNIMSQYEPAINVIKDIKLGSTNSDLTIEGALKGICTKSMFDAAVDSAKGGLKNNDGEAIDPSKIVCAFHNVSGGIRDNIKAGDITYGSVYSPFPFDNEVVLYKIKGGLLINKYGGFSTLGVYRVFDDKSYFDKDEYYYIVATDFIALSESYLMAPEFLKGLISEEKLIRTGKVVRDVVAEFIYKLDKVNGDDFTNKKEFAYIDN